MISRRLRTKTFVAVAACGVAFSSTAPIHGGDYTARAERDGQYEKLDSELQRRVEERPEREERVIISGPRFARPFVKLSLWVNGAEIGADHPSVNAFTATVRREDIASLSQSWLVDSISLDAPVAASHDDDSEVVFAAESDPQLLRETLGLSSSWTGDGIGVAVLDSGLDPSEGFDDRIRAFYDFTKNGIITAPFDDYGHGTHVAGLIGGEVAGVAPEVTFVVMKVLDKHGSGKTSDVIRALEFATINRVALRVDVINLSLGHPIYEEAARDPLVRAVEQAVAAGIVVVVSAGNHGRNGETGEVGYGGITSPGNTPSAITVGAVQTHGTVSRRDDRVLDFSSRGPTWYDAGVKPDIVAPGYRLVGDAAPTGELYQRYPALRVRAQGDDDDDDESRDYLMLSGTSMSAGVATGVVALMLEANRDTNGSRSRLSPNAVKAMQSRRERCGA